MCVWGGGHSNPSPERSRVCGHVPSYLCSSCGSWAAEGWSAGTSERRSGRQEREEEETEAVRMNQRRLFSAKRPGI